MSLVVTLRKFLSESIQPLTNSRDFDIKAAVRQVTGPDWRNLVNLVPKRVDLTTSDSPILYSSISASSAAAIKSNNLAVPPEARFYSVVYNLLI
ncbi:hypothetical protein sscle_09g073740 [Sclerotinia sclerotiorum 1980 UF-70]|uniref:Uncharacterized protein n=1 Tax=Sclerotinia sclerotiorum (strain ATCC 18683 / 1980 / Ss-1) TaxID=665079 RepID=A0A1D9QCC7_SCLS1|nr:hypothetical protein sscle_09g073740 [Sclerotinia sclerotiorum 1980 UF-70]